MAWSSISHSGLLRFVRITRLKVNLNRLKIYFWVTGILRKSLLTTLTKLLISLGITSGHLALLNTQFLPLLHAIIMRLSFEPSLHLKLHFTLFIRMCSLSFNKSILIYNFQCCCNATYIERTSQHLEVRVKQHVLRDIYICTHTHTHHSRHIKMVICFIKF